MWTPGLVMGVGRGVHRKDRNKREGAKESLLLFCWFLEAGILAPDSAGAGRAPHRLVDGHGDPGARQGARTLLTLLMSLRNVLPLMTGRSPCAAPVETGSRSPSLVCGPRCSLSPVQPEAQCEAGPLHALPLERAGAPPAGSAGPGIRGEVGGHAKYLSLVASLRFHFVRALGSLY